MIQTHLAILHDKVLPWKYLVDSTNKQQNLSLRMSFMNKLIYPFVLIARWLMSMLNVHFYRETSFLSLASRKFMSGMHIYYPAINTKRTITFNTNLTNLDKSFHLTEISSPQDKNTGMTLEDWYIPLHKVALYLRTGDTHQYLKCKKSLKFYLSLFNLA